MSQRKPEIIVVNVPKNWSDEDKEDLRLRLIKVTSHDKFENTQILITNKMDVKLVDIETMEKMRSI